MSLSTEEYSTPEKRKKLFRAALEYAGRKQIEISYDLRIANPSITDFVNEVKTSKRFFDWVRKNLNKVPFFDPEVYISQRAQKKL